MASPTEYIHHNKNILWVVHLSNFGFINERTDIILIYINVYS